MRVPARRSVGLFIILASLLTACGSSAPPSEAPPVEATAPPFSTAAPEAAVPTIAPTEARGILVPPGANMLVMLRGQARITHDNGAAWTASGTGQHLVAGDQIQITEDGLALVFLLNGGVVRLEGPSDFQLLRAERDAGTGATRFILKLWDGYALFETNPLPTVDSIFQFHVMTTFVSLEYDAALAETIGPNAALDPDRSVIAGGLLNEDRERLHHFRGPASLFLLDQLEGITFAAELPAAPDEYADLEAAFLDDYELESELEAFGVTAGYLIAECKRLGTCEGVDISGNTVARVDKLETGQTLYFFGFPPASELYDPSASAGVEGALGRLKALAAQQAQGSASGSFIRRIGLGRMAWRRMAGLPPGSLKPAVASLETGMLSDETRGFGCDPASGLGCMPPSDCDLAAGNGCDLPTGCNPITHYSCTDVYFAPTMVPEPGGGLRVDYPQAVDPGCDPNVAGDCSAAYDPAQWTYFEELDEEDEVAACWCPAHPPPPGYGPPPPGTFMYYRCFCSDPGARRDRPAQ